MLGNAGVWPISFLRCLFVFQASGIDGPDRLPDIDGFVIAGAVKEIDAFFLCGWGLCLIFAAENMT